MAEYTKLCWDGGTRGTGDATPPSPILRDQLTLSQLRGAHYAPNITICHPQIFRSSEGKKLAHVTRLKKNLYLVSLCVLPFVSMCDVLHKILKY